MSITDELREWYKDRLFMGNGWAEIDAIADRIDEQYRKALEKVAAMVDEHDDGWSGCRSCKAHKRGGVVECQVHGNMLRLDALERRIEALEKRCGKIAMFSYGENDKRIKDHERRVSAIERKLNHRGER